jgi:hypothetical protein
MMIADGKCRPEKLIGINVNIISDCRILNDYTYLRQNPKIADSLGSTINDNFQKLKPAV